MRCLRRRRAIPLKISKPFTFVIVTTVVVYLGLIFVALLKSSTLNENEHSIRASGREQKTEKRVDGSPSTALALNKATETQDTNLHRISHNRLFAEIRTNPVDKSPTKCKVAQHHNFPLCNSKFQFLKKMWKLSCFHHVHGVTENDCSMLQYLSEVEHFCPTLPHRERAHKAKDRGKLDIKSIRLDPNDLKKVLSEPSLSWLRLRVGQMWPGWREAGQQLLLQPYVRERAKKKLLFFLGSMSFQPWILKWAGHGGPLGELIQWTDLIAASYLLGHDINVVVNDSHLTRYLPSQDSKGCIPTVIEESKDYDIIFTDLNGMVILGSTLGSSAQSMLRCKLRVLDSFGTQAEFNQHGYPGQLPGGTSGWGNKDLVLGQFMTLFPHSPDNSFLGFVAGGKGKNINVKRKNRALIYGKLSSYFEGFKGYLDIAKEYFEIHATAVHVDNSLPDYVINHGSLTGKEIAGLLKQSKVFIGLGFPYEGPGPLEAACHGAVFINPKFSVPRNKLNDKFFGGKPTLRKLTSQSPYMEKFVGEPHVYTIDVNDTARVRQVMEEISKREVFEPYLPKEFTHFGFAERVLGYIQHQDFCYSTKPQWPPLKNRQVFLSFAGESCSDHCMRKGLVCEGTYFLSINKKEVFDSVGVQCLKTQMSALTHAPSYDVFENVCYLQARGLSFSCDSTRANYRRLCPCRNYEIEQVAICGGCLS